MEFAAIRSHYVQASVQFSIYLLWGWYAPEVSLQAPLILAQLIFLYALSALLSWSRGKNWQFGFGPMPIIFSTNLLLWFKHEWFFLQFVMVTLGALGKEFVRWNRDGKQTHIFNPSVFGQTLIALALIVTGTTSLFTWGSEMAVSFEKVPQIHLLIFAVGLIVQYLFSVTLMTLSATVVLCLLNLAYTGVTDVYYFMSVNIGATVFLGLHLLVTDPSTSPRSNVGKVIFGGLYGLGYFLLFRVLDNFGVPLFWDKLLPVAILNLCVPLIDRFSRSGAIGKLNQRWETALPLKKLNLIHMGCWVAFFFTLWGTGFIGGEHEGNSLSFWKKAYDEGKPRAGKNLYRMVDEGVASGSGEANNMLGVLFLEGKLITQDRTAAANYFARACELGYGIGCENVVGQFLFLKLARSPEDVERALKRLEQDCAQGTNENACFLLRAAAAK